MKITKSIKFLTRRILMKIRFPRGKVKGTKRSKREKGFLKWESNVGPKLIKNNVIISKKYNFGYISVPKVACTSIKSYLWRLEVGDPMLVIDSPHKFNQNPFEPLRVSGPKRSTQSNQRLRGRKFFAVVRHPTKRVISAYKDKILRTNAPQRLEIESILGIEPGAEISFHDFLIAIKSQDPRLLNPHWRPQSLILPVGLIDFQIFKLENLNEFEKWFTREFSPEFYQLPKENSSRKVNIVPTVDELKLINEIYRDDFVNFYYEE